MSNPYKELTQPAIYLAMQRRAGELLKPAGPRTREERAALAQDTAYLLLAAAFHVSRGVYSTASPQQTIANGTLSFKDAFFDDYEMHRREARWRTLSEATDLALDAGLHFHEQKVIIGGHDAYYAALNTDEGLAETLELLQQHFLAKKKKPR